MSWYKIELSPEDIVLGKQIEIIETFEHYSCLQVVQKKWHYLRQ